MFEAIAAFIEALLRVLFPPTGRHRAPDVSRCRRVWRRRRRALWLASVGIDTGPRRIHGVRVVS